MPTESLFDAFGTHARRRPDAPALVWRRERISYGRLARLADSAHALLGDGANPVGIVAEKSPATIAVVLACLRKRQSFLLAPPALPPSALYRLSRRAGCRLVLTPERITATVHERTPDLHRVRSAAQDDATFILTTSGSTGEPKLVPLTAGAVGRFTEWAAGRFGIRPGTTVLNYAPLNFDLCLLDIWTTLTHGGQVVLVDPGHATNAGHLLGLFADQEIDLVQAVPLFYRLLLDAGGGPIGGPRHVIVTGDSMPPRDFTALHQLFGGARLYNLYGCTETNDSFLHEVDPSAPRRSPVPIGIPVSGTEAVLVSPEGAVVDGAGTGELYVSTPFQSRGYLDGQRGEAKFVPDPRGGTRRFIRSGDLVRRHADGTITLEGRNDFHVKVAGVRVNTEAVERALGDHEGVVEAGVVAVPDALAGHRLHAVVRRRTGSRLNTLVLRRFCAQRLSRDAVPAVIHIVDDPLPRTTTGKVDRTRIGREMELA
jgi:acyl-coenzyme A synthetase/AMP-(fatty) acid ligase